MGMKWEDSHWGEEGKKEVAVPGGAVADRVDGIGYK